MNRAQAEMLANALTDFIASNSDDMWFAGYAWFADNPTPGCDLNIWESGGEIKAAVYPLKTNSEDTVETNTVAEPVWLIGGPQ